jgi:ribosomal protein S18 acetylase RimI-like enzyme
VDALADRAHANLCAYTRWTHRLSPAGRLLDRDGIVAVTTPVDWPSCRLAVRANDDLTATAWIDAAGEFLFADGKTACIFARDDTDDDLLSELLERGFAEFASSPEMVCETAREPRHAPEGFGVRIASSPVDIDGYARVTSEAFAHLHFPADESLRMLAQPDPMLAPDVAVAIAEAADGTIVAGAMVVLFTEPEPTGYVSFVACADAARGHGLGDAVTRMVTNEAFARGVTLCTLEASHFGRNTYDRMGYRTLYDYRLLIKV